jgi:hypothetical protein
MTPHNRFTLSFTVDHNRAVDLHDAGGGDYRAVVVVGPGGLESYALHSTKDWDQTAPIPIPKSPEHERMGPLPLNYRRLIDAVMSGKPHDNGVSLCGQPTRTGRLCRARVAVLGHACHRHRI